MIENRCKTWLRRQAIIKNYQEFDILILYYSTVRLSRLIKESTSPDAQS